MQFIKKDKLIKVLEQEQNVLDINRLEEILNVYGDTYYVEGCNWELCKKGKEISAVES
ncbi:metal-dependent hydrolase [Clostridium acetobutylicum]|nr:metal-dependent hydrolase [Clostridium acetobutylicum]